MKLICIHGVCSPEECHQCLRERASADAEREAVVRWLREAADWSSSFAAGPLRNAADAIERDEHLKPKPTPGITASGAHGTSVPINGDDTP